MKRLILPLLILISQGICAQNDFAFLLNGAFKPENNYFFSPVSIKSAFAMAYEGANGNTQKEFERVFGFQENNKAFHEQLNELKKSAEITNSLWILNEFEVLDAFLDKMNADFSAKPNYTDFKNDPVGSADKINKWIEESTNGMIKKMLSPEAVTDFKLALVNAIYFKQDWKRPFDKGRTEEELFTNLEGGQKSVKMMHSFDNFVAYEGFKEKVIELPYADNKTSMVVILPNKMKGYKLTNEVYSDLIKRLYPQKVNLSLPRFTFETPTIELKDILIVLGLKEAFEDQADFSGMRMEKDLKIGTALHKAKIIVNEEGTEAAAATVIGMVATCSVSQPVPIMEFKVDKPFYYFIKDNATGAILFMGKMNDMN